jgi:cyclin-dependent kinase
MCVRQQDFTRVCTSKGLRVRTDLQHAACLTQVFEFLSTDLKKFMDRNGKGPAHPLPKEIVKVRVVWRERGAA